MSSEDYEYAQYLLDHQEGVEIPTDRCAVCGNTGELLKKALVRMGQVEIVRICERCK